MYLTRLPEYRFVKCDLLHMLTLKLLEAVRDEFWETPSDCTTQKSEGFEPTIPAVTAIGDLREYLFKTVTETAGLCYLRLIILLLKSCPWSGSAENHIFRLSRPFTI
jgi:hypothetical protein